MRERTATDRSRTGDEGVTLVEVIVAMFVLAIISSGLIAGMVTITKTTADNRAQVVAANLAAQDIDLVRAIGDPFKVTSKPATGVDVAGRTYSVARSVNWVSQAGAEVSCNSSTDLYFLRVNVRVTWKGQLGTQAVQDDTILAPAARTNNAKSGSIAVAITGVDGQPRSGVDVRVVAKSGGTGVTPTTQPADTGTDGCSYATNLVPGDYVVTISSSGWVDPSQQAEPTKDPVVVTAGATRSVTFQYDRGAAYQTTYAANYLSTASASSTGPALLPMSMDTNFINTNGTYTTATPGAKVRLYPFSSGYSVVTGDTQSGTTSCASADPQAWVAGTVNGVALGNGVRASAAYASGTVGPLSIPMGVVVVKNVPSGQLLGATQSNTMVNGNPGCGISGQIYTFNTSGASGTFAIALPYGAWRIGYGTSISNAQFVSPSNLSVPTNAAGATVGVSADGTVTLDPRPLAR